MSLVVVFGGLVILVGIAVLVVLVVVLVARSRRAQDYSDQPGLRQQRLDHLDRRHAAGKLTDDEHAAARARILGTL